jgi:O-antigen ligase
MAKTEMEELKDQKLLNYLLIGFLGVLFLATGFFTPTYPIAPLLFLIVAILILFISKLEFGLYLMIFFLPVINWNFYFGSLEVPFIDLLGLAVFIAFFLKTFYRLFLDRKKFSLRLPLLIPFFLFFTSVTISNVLSEYIGGNIWYSIRWILFFYLVYLTLPVNIIKNEKILRNSLICFMLSGLTVAVMGVLSIFQQDWQYAFIRTLPIKIFGIYPIGDNHNLVAEVLIVSLFFTQALKYWSNSVKLNRLLNILMIFQALVLLATFSRAAWLALAIQVILFLFFINKKTREQLLVVLLFCLIILSPLSVYMYKVQSDFSIGGSSTETRILMSQIAWDKFKEKPLFGFGSGQFENFTANDLRFIAKYGGPLDSHGVWQKVLAENGLFGIFTFALLFLSIITLFYRTLRKYQEQTKLLLPIFLGGIGMFVVQFFNTSYYKGKLWLPLALGLVAINIVRKKTRESKQKKNLSA